MWGGGALPKKIEPQITPNVPQYNNVSYCKIVKNIGMKVKKENKNHFQKIESVSMHVIL